VPKKNIGVEPDPNTPEGLEYWKLKYGIKERPGDRKPLSSFFSRALEVLYVHARLLVWVHATYEPRESTYNACAPADVYDTVKTYTDRLTDSHMHTHTHTNTHTHTPTDSQTGTHTHTLSLSLPLSLRKTQGGFHRKPSPP
jgi:hypothetical protein